MKKLIAVIVFCIIAFDICIVWYLTNRNDAQYKAYYMENAATEARSKNDINTYFKYMDNPVTVKYHYGHSFILASTYADTGHYDDAIRVANSFEKERNYSYCAQYKTAMRFLCRLSDVVSNAFYSNDMQFDKNIILSYIYFKTVDYDKAIEYDNQRIKSRACFSARLHAEAGDIKKAESLLPNCNSDLQHNMVSGLIAYKNKDYKAAEKFYLQAVNPNCDSSRCYANNDAYLYLAELYKITSQNLLNMLKKCWQMNPTIIKQNCF